MTDTAVTPETSQTQPAAPQRSRTPWIIALAMSVVANGVLFTQNRTLAMQYTQAQKAAKHYQEAYTAVYDKEIRLMQDFTTLYIANVTQLQQSGAAGDRQRALDSIDAANFFAGFLSRHSQDGEHLSSAEYATKLATGRLGQADQDKLKAITMRAQGTLDRVSQQLTALRDAKPGDEAPAGMPSLPPMPAGHPSAQ